MYKLTQTNTLIHLLDNTLIPADPANTDYKQYLDWVAKGNTPEPYVEPEPTPLELLAKLDADNALTQRNLREFIQLVTEALKVATNNSVDLSQVPGVAKVYQVEAQAVQLRARL